MAAPYTRGSNPIWSMVDLTGHQFDDTFYMFVLENTIPYIPATVYHTVSGIPWTNPIQFLANGTLPVDIFWDSDQVYRLEFRQGATQSDPLIYEVDNYSPGNSGDMPIDTTAVTTDNQITNPQFSLINFISPFTYSATDPEPLEVAPGWFLNLTGSGTVTLERLAINSALANPTNAPYALRITLSGLWTGTPYLSQRFEQNGMLWSTFTNNRYVSNSITAKVETTPVTISAQLFDSMGTALTTVLDSQIINTTFNEYIDHGLMPITSNTDTPPDAWIEYRLFLSTSIDIYLTSLQLISSNTLTDYTYIQDSIERQQDHTFHYYNPKLQFKPIPSLLTAWDFALNPRQFGLVTPVVAAPKYYLDQTIMGSVTGNITVSVNAATNGITLVNDSADEAVFLLQYLEGAQAQKILGSRWAVNLQSWCNANNVVARVYLYRGSSAAVIPDILTNKTIGSLANTGVFTKNNTAGEGQNWTEIARNIGQDAYGSVANVTVNADINNPDVDLGFAGWEVTDNTEIGDTDKFAIVVTFQIPTITTTLNVQSVGLVPGDIPTRPAPQSKDEVLRECQVYYETSYDPGVAAGTAGQPGILSIQRLSGNDCLALTFQVPYRVPKRAIPTSAFVAFYNPTTGLTTFPMTAFAVVAAGASNSNAVVRTNWLFSDPTEYYCVMQADSVVALATQVGATEAYITYHFEADARLGVL